MGEMVRPIAPPPISAQAEQALPVSWREFIRFCRELGYGEIEQLKIQDGVPVLAEMTRKKVRFGPER